MTVVIYQGSFLLGSLQRARPRREDTQVLWVATQSSPSQGGHPDMYHVQWPGFHKAQLERLGFQGPAVFKNRREASSIFSNLAEQILVAFVSSTIALFLL